MATQDTSSLKERLEKIKSPKLQNQKETAVVLNAVEDTLRDQGHDEFTPTAYFAALLALLSQAISRVTGIVNKELATSVVYLLDIITSYVPVPLLRSKFTQILASLAPALTQSDVESPLLRHSMGCLESLLLAQDSAAWSLPQTQVGPRGAVAGILSLAVDHRPKVRKRAQDALTKVLKNAPPSPSVDHPAADMCAETALHSLREISQAASKKHKSRSAMEEESYPSLIHALQLVRTIAAASGGWPSKRIDPLCEVLLNLSKSNNEYLAMTSFEVFETIFVGMANEASAAKLPRLLEAVSALRPSQNDAQLLPPWIAVLARGYDVSAQVDAQETFLKLPELFDTVSDFLASPSHNIRTSASECLISFTATCIPQSVILDPSVYDEKILEKISKTATNLLSVKYQAAWMEVFKVLSALFEALKWRSTPYLNEVVKLVGDLRSNDNFNGKKEADAVLSEAIGAAGPEAVLELLPLNLAKPPSGHPGRVWLLPLLRDNVMNATIKHFKSELIPLSEVMFQRVLDHGSKDKTNQVKLFETVVSQIWSILPGYFTLPLDMVESFDQGLAELLSNLLYQQAQLRTDICHALKALIDSNKQILSVDGEEDLILQRRITKEAAQKNLDHLSSFSANLLAVLFNVYSGTLPHLRGYILQCINAYLSITPEKELVETFERVTTLLEDALQESTARVQASKQKQNKSADQMPPTSHTLMDLLITLSMYLPRSSYQKLFSVAALLLPQSLDPQLQKKAYKLLPRLATSTVGSQALRERNIELQELLLSSAASASAPARKDRLDAISVVVEHLPSSTMHFIPLILPEVVIALKEVNEKARSVAFDLLIQMGRKMSEGGTIQQSKLPLMPDDAPSKKASLEEYFTMATAGLAGTTPHMISASILAITRILYEFRASLSDDVMHEIVLTMNLFLESKNREIVRSILGFSKVAIISLPDDIINPKLPDLIPKLITWGHEHTNQFRAKVKHIVERAIRRFGYEAVEKYTPEEDKKLIHNIQKTKGRNKRQKAATTSANANGEDVGPEPKSKQHQNKFASEFDQAVYGSSSSASSDSDSDASADSFDAEALPPKSHSRKGKPSTKQKNQSKTYILDPEDPAADPLDLLSPNALASVSHSKPFRLRDAAQIKRRKAKTNADGKLVFDESEDEKMLDVGKEGDGGAGIGAYVQAISGRDAVRRGNRGRLTVKSSQRRARDGEEMDIDDDDDDDDVGEGMKKGKSKEREGRNGEKKGKGKEGSDKGYGEKGRKRVDGGKKEKGGRFRVAKARARGGRIGGKGKVGR